MQETLFRSLGQEDSLEEEMATHSCILAWKSHGLRSLGYSPWGYKKSDTTELACNAIQNKKLKKKVFFRPNKIHQPKSATSYQSATPKDREDEAQGGKWFAPDCAPCAGYTAIPGTQSFSQEPDLVPGYRDSILSPQQAGTWEPEPLVSRYSWSALLHSLPEGCRSRGFWLSAHSTPITVLTGSDEKVLVGLPMNPESSWKDSLALAPMGAGRGFTDLRLSTFLYPVCP